MGLAPSYDQCMRGVSGVAKNIPAPSRNPTAGLEGLLNTDSGSDWGSNTELGHQMNFLEGFLFRF